MSAASKKLAQLIDTLRPYGRLAVSYSGGVDSTLLVHAARQALGRDNVLALTALSRLLPADEARDADMTATALDVNYITCAIDPLSLPAVQHNTPDRCYHCKYMILSTLKELAAARGFSVLCDGSNADDAKANRPGQRAVAQLLVATPLALYSKEEIRQMSRAAGLPTAQKPSAPCLATRFPYHADITTRALMQVEAAEKELIGRGFPVCRVRCHGDLARVEVPLKEVGRLLSHCDLPRVFHLFGFSHVTVDLEGFRSGCFDKKE